MIPVLNYNYSCGPDHAALSSQQGAAAGQHSKRTLRYQVQPNSDTWVKSQLTEGRCACDLHIARSTEDTGD